MAGGAVAALLSFVVDRQVAAMVGTDTWAAPREVVVHLCCLARIASRDTAAVVVLVVSAAAEVAVVLRFPRSRSTASRAQGIEPLHWIVPVGRKALHPSVA